MAAEDDSEMYMDPNTYSNYRDICVVHSDIEWEVHFESTQLVGCVTHTIKRLNKEVTILSLDTYDLQVDKVTFDEQDLPFVIAPRNETHPASFGRQLDIDLENVKFSDYRSESEKKENPNVKAEMCKIRIDYATSSSAAAIGWLEAEITDGGKLPYLFTQCQPIGARTMMPCQDTPGNKFTYNAIVKTPKKYKNQDCQFTAYMSAPTSDEFTKCDNKCDAQWSVHNIKQPRRIPSYLLALVVGNIDQEIVGDRKVCLVVTEPVNMKAVKWEFENMQSYLTIAESLCGKYRWSTYGCLVLPSSFPYGGMENPNLTFVTPTLIAGDRSLVNVVAHEITHSWSGNLVTNESWEHFWLNEGWTKFIEMKIMEKKVTIDKEAEKLGIKVESEKFTKIDFSKVSKESRDYGAKYHALLMMNGHHNLEEAIEQFGKTHEFTKLNLCLDNEDPDDAFSSVPYEKGAEFITYLENLVGGPSKFAPFILKYFDTFAEQSIGSNDFKDFIINYFDEVSNETGILLKTSVEWEKWLHGAGLPPVDVKSTLESKAKKLNVDNLFELINVVTDLVNEWGNLKNVNDDAEHKDNEKLKNGMNGWMVDQKEMFLDQMLVQWKSQLEKKETTLELLRKKLSLMNKMYNLLPDSGKASDEKKDDSNDESSSGGGNNEIMFRFFLLAMECEEESLYQSVISRMLSRVGRMKYVRPLYRALARKNHKMAQEAFDKYKATQYHPICAKMVQRDLEKAKPQK